MHAGATMSLRYIRPQCSSLKGGSIGGSVRYGDEPLQSSMSGVRAIPLGLHLSRDLHHTSVTSLKDDVSDHAQLSQPRLMPSAKTSRHRKSYLKKMTVHMQKEFTVHHRTSQGYYQSKVTLISPEDRRYKKRDFPNIVHRYVPPSDTQVMDRHGARRRSPSG